MCSCTCRARTCSSSSRLLALVHARGSCLPIFVPAHVPARPYQCFRRPERTRSVARSSLCGAGTCSCCVLARARIHYELVPGGSYLLALVLVPARARALASSYAAHCFRTCSRSCLARCSSLLQKGSATVLSSTLPHACICSRSLPARAHTRTARSLHAVHRARAAYPCLRASTSSSSLYV